MQLYYSETSPFARKVRMFLHFTGQIDECELVATSLDSDELRAKNPLGKIPALVSQNLVLFESNLICEYLDDLWCVAGNLSLLNRGSQSYYLEQKALATADGVTEAAVSAMFENRRDGARSEYWLSRWRKAIQQALLDIDLAHCGTAERPNMPGFSLAAALGYLDFRHPNIPWRAFREELDTWHSSISGTTWFEQTMPPK